MLVKDAVTEYEIACLRLSPHTTRWYSSKLKVFVAWCEEQNLQLESLTIKHIRLFLESLKSRINTRTEKPISSHTIFGYAAVVKQFLYWCTREEDFDKLVPANLPGKIEPPIIDEKVIDVYTNDQIKAFLEACKKSGDFEARDRAIIMVLIDTGIRMDELCKLTVECCYLYPDDAYLKVYGKRNKWREVPLGRNSLAALRRYITRWRRPKKKDEQCVFLTRYGTPVKQPTVDTLIKRLGRQAGITGVRISAHTFRHTFSVNYLKNGGDVLRLSRLLGHSRLAITENYLKQFQSREARQNGISVLDSLQERSK